METSSKPAKKGGRGQFWLALHGWCSLPIWVFLLFVCLTGTIATVASEIVWLYDPEVRASPQGDKPTVNFDTAIASIETHYPHSKVQYIYIREPYLAWEAITSMPDAPRATVHINPYTGEVQGRTIWAGLQNFVTGLHGWLLMPFSTGYNLGWYMVTALSIPMIGSLITGLVVYKRFWRGFLNPQLRRDKGSRIFWGDLHRLAGIWSIWFITIMSLTGLWFLIQAVLNDNQIPTYSIDPIMAREASPVVKDGSRPPVITIEQAFKKAGAALPGLKPHYIVPPSNGFDYYYFYGTTGTPFFSDYSERVVLNPYSGEVMNAVAIKDIGGLELIAQVVPTLHFGTFAGIYSKAVWFIFGSLLTLMVASGVVIWTKRAVKATVTAFRAVPVAAE
jgi:uncharacterized iron-regulated membrane protein